MEDTQVEYHIVGPNGYQGSRDSEDHHIQDLVLVDPESLSPPGAQDDCQDQAGHNDDAVPVDRPAQYRKRHSVQGKFQSQTWKGHRINQACPPSLGRTTDRAARSSVTQRPIRSSASSLVMELNKSANWRKFTPAKKDRA